MVLGGQFAVIQAYTAAEGLKLLRDCDPAVVLLDINLPDMDGIRLLEKIQTFPMPPPVIMLTAFSDVKLVVAAVHNGAYDYIVKPYSTKQLTGTIRKAIQNIPARKAHVASSSHPSLNAIVGESMAMQNLKELILRFGPTDSTVFITGASGTGKELVARALHEVSPRASQPFVAVNCGALPDTLLESELFGSERGAFTDAVTRPGSFERANEGTILLDEIGEMSPQAQIRLLRLLEQKEVTRVGGTQAIPINVRVICATNADCKERMKTGRFREDLYYRVAVLPIDVPSLRSREEDVLLLAAHFVRESAGATKKLDPPARDKLLSHPWPGNVRELRNVMERAILLSRGEHIRAADIIL